VPSPNWVTKDGTFTGLIRFTCFWTCLDFLYNLNAQLTGTAHMRETKERMVKKMPDIEIPKCVVSEPSVELNIIKTPLLN
jgi:hypothetical protein